MTGLEILFTVLALAGGGVAVWLLWRLALATERTAEILEISHEADIRGVKAAREKESAELPASSTQRRFTTM